MAKHRFIPCCYLCQRNNGGSGAHRLPHRDLRRIGRRRRLKR